MTPIKGRLSFIVMIVLFLSGCGAAVPIVAGAVETAVDVAPIVVPLAIDVSSHLAEQSIAMATGMEEEKAADAYYADKSHAMEKHGGDAVTKVKNCLSAKGAVLRMWNPQSDRHASVCEVGHDNFGVEIDEGSGDFVTAFIPKKYQSLQDVLDYLAHYGYLRQ